jgi:predicted RNA-binding Zn-ribbon protein involved in translation (DUF1610 family)
MATTQRTIVCYFCKHALEVSTRTITHSCPACNKRLVVEDITIKTLYSVVKLQTCGRLIVEPKGHVIAQHVDAQLGVDMQGQMEASVRSGGPVRIGPKARWKGDCKAPSVKIEPGAKIEAGAFTIDPLDKVAETMPAQPAPTS